MFKPDEISDNSMISVYPFGDEYYTFAEAPVMHRIDAKTLETTGRVKTFKNVFYINCINYFYHYLLIKYNKINFGLIKNKFFL